MTGTVLWTMNEWYAVAVSGVEWRCRLRGVLRRDGQQAVLPVVGDRVDVRPTGEGEGVIEAIHARQGVFSRRSAGGKGAWREQVLAANIDQVLVVFAAATPAPKPRTIDRFLVIAEANRLPAHLIINKIDLTGREEAEAALGQYARCGYDVRYVSAISNVGLEGLHELLRDRCTLITGPSGVGKSSVINALVPGIDLRTGEVSRSLNKGRHTTMVGRLFALPWGGYVADTPGLRELAPWDLPPEDVADCFPEFRPLLDQCRWLPCLHRNEQGCAVREAATAGIITEIRYDSYNRILEDALEAERLALRATRNGR